MGKFRQILMMLSARDTPIFSFPDDNLSKHQWIFTKLGMYIDIVEICFGIANGQISMGKFQGILTKLGTCIDMKEIWFGIANDKFCQCLTGLSARDTILVGYYSLMFLF